MSLTREKIESLAPDQSSLAAALKLVKPASWPVLSANADTSLLWGECQGSGSTPYRVVVSPDDVGYKCTCPSRKFPCKHVLALLYLKFEKPERFEPAAPPQWIDEWISRRRPGGGNPAGRPKPDGGEPKAAPSLDAALNAEQEPERQPDLKAAAQAEAQRQRLKAEREAAIVQGLDELDRWIVDQLNQGLAGFAGRAQTAVRTLSTRLVDAKAGALAGRLDGLATELFGVPESQRADVAMERLAAIALISSAYRRQDRLPAVLKNDVRRAAGWTVKREDLLADPTAPSVAATWIVAANLSEVQPDKLRRLETWLVNATPKDDQPRAALLIDFVPVSGGAFGFAYEPGETIEGEIVFYPSAAPLRGLMASRQAGGTHARWPAADRAGLSAALDEFARQLQALPWIERWPLMASGVEIFRSQKGQLMIGDRTGVMAPIDKGQTDALLPMVGLGGLSLFFTWDGRSARILAADTPVGRWHEG